MSARPPLAFARELSAATATSALPVGYALTIWCTGALLIHRHGNANVGDVFLFLAGAIAGWVVWPLATFVATVTYLLLAALELLLLGRAMS